MEKQENTEQESRDIEVDEYKDIPIEFLDSSKKRFLHWEAFDD
jgi:hypothetical protein